jgi:fibronectin-binding autotransporter adhesin
MKSKRNARTKCAGRGRSIVFSLLQSKRHRVFASALAAGVGLTLGTQTRAANLDTWVGNDGSTTNWSDGADWLSGSAPASGDSLNFGAAGSSGTALNDNLGAGFSLGSISFLTGASGYTFSTNNSSSIDLGTGGVATITNSSSSLETISNINLILQGNLTDDTAYGNETINSVISGGTYGLLKTGSGELTLTGANTYTGQTTIGATSTGAGTTATTGYGGGTLDLNFAGAGALTSNILYNGVTAGQVNFGGGTLEIDGAASTANSQTLGTLNLTAGFSTIDLNPGTSGTVTLTTGSWTSPTNVISSNNALAGQMNLLIPTGATMTTTQGNASSATAVSGVLSFGNILANVTVNETSWAERSGGDVIALPTSSYFASTTSKVGSASQATDVVTNVTSVLAADVTNTIRFNTAANETIDLLIASLTLDGGGILMTPNAGANTESIAGGAFGTLAGAPNAGLSIFQYDTLGTLSINVVIKDNGNNNSVTIGGGGLVSMGTGAVDTNTGNTNINDGTLEIVQDSNLGAVATGAALNIDGGTLEAAATFSLYNSSTTGLTGVRNIGIGSMGATFDVTSTFALTIPGSITSQNIAGAGNLTKTDTGILILSGTNSYTGNTTVNAGILELSNALALPGGVGATGGTSALIINGGMVGLSTGATTFNRGVGLGSNQVQWISSGGFVAMSGNATVNFGGAGAGVKWNTNGFVPNGSTLAFGTSQGTGSVTISNPIDFDGAVQTIQAVPQTSSAAIAGILSGALSDGGFNKTGTGTLELTGVSTYTGATNINAGALLMGTGGSLGNTAVAINTGGNLTTNNATSAIAGIVTINSGGAINLENGATGDTLTLGGLNLPGGGAVDLDLTPTGHATNGLVISAGGTITDTGLTTLNFADTSTVALTTGTYNLMNNVPSNAATDFVYNPNQFSSLSLSVAVSGSSLVLTVSSPAAASAVAYWKGGVDSVWSDASNGSTNWVNSTGGAIGLPGSGTQVVFSYSGGATNQASTTIGSVTAVDSLVINDPTNLTIGGTGTLTVGPASVSNGIMLATTAGTDTISVTGLALSKSQTWDNASSNTLTISSIVSGTSTLTINSSGTGDILLTGANTFSGPTIITAGTLQIGNAAALGTSSATFSGGTLDLNGHALTMRGINGTAGTITDSSTTAAVLTDSLAAGTVTFAGSIVNGSGTVGLTTSGSGVQILTGSSNTYGGGTTIGGTSTLVIGDGVTNLGSLPGNVSDGHTLVFNTPGGDTFSYGGNISGTGSVVLSGTGKVNLSGTNTMTGGVTVNSGTLQLGSNTGVSSAPVTMANATFDLNSFSPTITALSSASTSINAVITNSSTAAVSTLTVGATGNYYGTISDGAAVGGTALTLTGGTLGLFNANNSYTGPTTINGGVLLLKGGGSLANTAVAINTGGALSTSGITSKIAGLVTLNTGGVINLENGAAGNLLTLNGGLSLTGGGAIDFDLSATTGINDSLAFSNGATFSDVGTTALSFAVPTGTLQVGSSYTLISNAPGISASDFTYNSDFSSSLSFSVSTNGNSLVLTVDGPPPPTPFAYWNGNLNSVWSDTSGNSTNWVSAASGGTPVALPTSGTQVFFSATGATNQASTTIGAITAVDSITILDPTNLTIGGTSTLTLEGVATGYGITLQSTAGKDLIDTKGIALGGPQTWANNSSSLLTISSVISGSTANVLTINSTGTGDILLEGADTYSGGTVLTAGTLQVGSTTALGTGLATFSGGTLDLNGHALTLSKGFGGASGTITDSSTTAATLTDGLTTGTATFGGSITNGSGTVALSLTGAGVQILTGTGNTYTGVTTIGTTSTLVIGDGVANAGSLTGNVTDNHDLIFDTPASDTLTYAGNASVAGATGTILISGPGTTNLAGNNTVSGTVAVVGVVVNAGTLQMGSNTGLNNIPLTLANTTLDMNSFSPTVTTLTTASTATSAVITNSSTAAVSTLTITGGGNYYGTINDGAAAGGTAITLTAGTLALFNSGNTYTGATTINGGTLLLKGGGSLGNTPVAINNTGTLTTVGTTSAITGSVTVNTGGALDLRNGTPGNALTIGTLNLAGGGSLGFDLSATSTTSDELNITNFSNVGTTALNFTEIGTLPATTTLTYTLINGGSGNINVNDFSYNSTVTNGINSYIASLSSNGSDLLLTIANAPPPPNFAYWTGAVSTTWSDGAGSSLTNWVDQSQSPAPVNVIPGGPTQVIFSSTTNPVQNEASTNLGSVNAVDSLTLNTATSLTINGAGTLTIVADNNNGNDNNGIVVGAAGGTDVINIAGISLGGPQTWSNNSNNLLTVNSVITGGSADSLTINNSGTADILLTGNNSYTGGTVIQDGTLQIGSSTALGAGPLAVNGGTLDLNGQSVLLQGISGSGGLITDSTDTFATITSSMAVGTTMTYAGNITNGAGVVNIALTGGGLQILLGSGNTYSGGTSIAYPGTMQIGDGVSNVGSFNGNTTDNGMLAFDTPASSTITYSGNTSGLLGTIAQIGTGTVVLSGDNIVDLGVAIDSGEMQMGSSTGIDDIPVTMGAGAILDLNTFSITAYDLNAAATATTAVVTNNGPNTTTSTLSITGAGTSTYNGEINTGANGGNVALNMTAGTLILTNMSSTYSAGTTVIGGTLEAGNGTTPTTGFEPYTDNILGTGFVTVSNGTLELNSQSTASAAIGLQFNFSNSITLSGGATLSDVAGINYLGGPFVINGTGNTITISQAQMPLEIGGNLSGTGSATISGASTATLSNLELFGDGTGFTGTLTLSATTAQLFIGSNTALNNANISITGNGTTTQNVNTYYPNNAGSALVFSPTPGDNEPIIGSINSATTGSGNIDLVTSDGQSPVFLSIGNNNGNSKLSGIISDIPTYTGATSLGSQIIKIGTGSLTLSGANTFSGGVVIDSGTLLAGYTVSSATASSTGIGPVTLTGGVLASVAGAKSYVMGVVTAGNTTTNTIAPGGVGTIGSLVIGGLTSTNLTTLDFDLGTGSGEVTNGDLLTLGTGTVSIGAGTLMSFGGSPVGGDDYRLMGDTSGGTVVDAIPLTNFTLPTAPAGFTYALSNSVDAGFIDLVVSGGGGPVSLTWNNAGGASPSDGQTWDINHNNNWNSGSAATVFLNGDNITFNDSNNSGSNPNAYNVTLNTVVTPGSVTVNNSSGNYAISGAGTIAGTGALSKSGSASLTLSVAGTYTGGTNVSAGTLIEAAAAAIPNASAVSISGTGVMRLADNITAGTPYGTSNVVLSSLSLSGNGTLDIGNNHIIIDYTAGHDPIASIQQWIANGFASGDVAGSGPEIISTDIATDDSTSGLSYGIGYADGADGVIAGLPSGEIEIMYTLLGDTNLDGTVNAEDYTPFSHDIGLSGMSWDDGDFNYDGTVNSEDYTPFSHNIGQSASLAAASGTLEPANSLLTNEPESTSPSLTNVPEPASTGLIALGAVSVLARRRRKNHL